MERYGYKVNMLRKLIKLLHLHESIGKPREEKTYTKAYYSPAPLHDTLQPL
jgi:hypothetical protein